MLQDGQKGAILLRQSGKYALTPRLLPGLIESDTMKKIAVAANAFDADGLVTNPDGTISVIGVKEEQVDQFWEYLGLPPSVTPVKPVVHCIACCLGLKHCKQAMQDSFSLAQRLDKKYYGEQLPAELKIYVSGCVYDCRASLTADIGFSGTFRGWRVVAGGVTGTVYRTATVITENTDLRSALNIVDNIIDLYKNNAKNRQKLGPFIDSIGIEKFIKSVATNSPETDHIYKLKQNHPSEGIKSVD
jgi:NAD(P)H-nitrite reductase large subunit